jgi:hypothetical protein
MVAPTPENVKGWFATLWPAMQAASPITVALLLVLWFLSIRWFTAELSRTHVVNQSLWERLMEAQAKQTDLAWRCYQGAPPHEQEGR